MVTLEQAENYTKKRFSEENIDDRIEDRGFAFYINTQPRGYLDGDKMAMTLGNGPLVIIKQTGEVYSFSSSPKYMVGVNIAKSSGEFDKALGELGASLGGSLNPIDHIA